MTSLSHMIISSCQKALTMNLANGVHEFFFKRISHVRALHILERFLLILNRWGIPTGAIL